MTHNNEKAPEQGGEKELKGLLKTIVTVASKSWDAAVLHTRDVSSHPPTYPNKQTFINNLMEEYAKEYAASQNNQGEGNCKCDNEIKTGQTSAMCCNICGLPDDENWKVPSPLPGTTVQGYSEASLSTPQDEGWVEIAQGGDMPEEDEDCLVWTELAKKGQASTFKNKKFYRYSNAVESDRMALYYFPDVTHWRKLPSPPTI